MFHAMLFFLAFIKQICDLKLRSINYRRPPTVLGVICKPRIPWVVYLEIGKDC